MSRPFNVFSFFLLPKASTSATREMSGKRQLVKNVSELIFLLCCLLFLLFFFLKLLFKQPLFNSAPQQSSFHTASDGTGRFMGSLVQVPTLVCMTCFLSFFPALSNAFSFYFVQPRLDEIRFTLDPIGNVNP